MSKQTYAFSVDHPDKFDLKRILEENSDKELIIVLVSSDPNRAILCLNNKFTSSFFGGDKLSIDDEKLVPSWGFSRNYELDTDHKIYREDNGSITGFRCRITKASNINNVLEEFRAAKSFQRKIKVNVITLKDE